MKYKILKGSPTYEQLTAILEKGNACKKQADDLAKEVGAYDYCGGRGAWGGIRALCFKEKPEGYKLLQYPDYYYPKSLKANRALLAKLAALPEVSNGELSAPLGYKRQSFCRDGGLYMSSRPGVDFLADCILIEVADEAKFQPGPDLIEILASEFMTLRAAHLATQGK